MIDFCDTGREHRMLSVFTLAFGQKREQGVQSPLGHQPDFSQSKKLCTLNRETIRPAQEATVLTHMLFTEVTTSGLSEYPCKGQNIH